MKRWDNRFRIEEALDCRQALNTAETQDPVEEWAADLKLLKGVPLSYLAGDERQLPPESIRFFYLDESWTDQLVNGALSIGAGDQKAGAINAAFVKEIHEKSRQRLHMSREKRMHRLQKAFYKRKAAEDSDGQKITGFLLRSQLTRLWKGLESTAWDKDGEQLPILRMEQLSGEIMICLYQGEINRLCVKEPKEGLRFGAHEDDRTIRVRDIKTRNEGRPLDDKKVKIETNAEGRADILGLADELKKQLGADTLTSAELAMELIVAPGVAEFMDKPGE